MTESVSSSGRKPGLFDEAAGAADLIASATTASSAAASTHLSSYEGGTNGVHRNPLFDA